VDSETAVGNGGKVSMREVARMVVLEGDADSMFEHHQLERIDERTNDVGSLSVLHEA